MRICMCGQNMYVEYTYLMSGKNMDSCAACPSERTHSYWTRSIHGSWIPVKSTKNSTHARIVSSPHSDAVDDDDDDVARVRRVGDASRRWEDRSRARAGRAFARAPDASRELDVDDDGIDDDEWISTTRAGFDDDARVSSRR